MEKELPDTPGSEEGLVGLTELEPSPVEESPAEAGKDGYFPSPSPSPPPLLGRSTTLGLNNHGPAYYRKCFVYLTADASIAPLRC